MARTGPEGLSGREEKPARMSFFVVALWACKGEDVHLKSEAFLAHSKAEAYNIAYLNCRFEYPPEEGFNNHLASVGEVPGKKLRLIIDKVDPL